MEGRGRQQERAEGDGPKRASAYVAGVFKLEWLFRDILRWAKMFRTSYTRKG